jgi:uncharacterized protein (TIGR03032 family)
MASDPSKPDVEKAAQDGSGGQGTAALRSMHTTTFPKIVQPFGSLAVTTYQAGKLVLLRPELREGELVLNTHFRSFRKPMGFAWEQGRFAIGTAAEVWEFHDMPAVARKLESDQSKTQHDACFLPRSAHVTGDVQVHEMVWVPAAKPAAGKGAGYSCPSSAARAQN